MNTPPVNRGQGNAELNSAWANLLAGSAHAPAAKRLIGAAADSDLRRFYPFRSLGRLCFARSPYPFAGILPGFVIFGRDDSYQACSGNPYDEVSQALLIRTADPAEAVDAVLAALNLEQ